MSRLVALGIVGLISAYTLVPLTNSGMLVSDDGMAHLARTRSLATALKQGMLLPRWAPDLNFGYGSPVFSYNWLVPYYVAALGVLAGLGEVESFKVTMGLGFVLSALMSYLWLRGRYGRLGGLIGSTLYTLAPYRLMNVYERGTPGEVWVALFPPLILWLTDVHSIKKWRMVLLPLLWAGMFLTHSVVGMLLTPMILLLSCFKTLKSVYPDWQSSVAACLLGAMIAAFNWFPAAFEAPYLTNVGDYFLSVSPDIHRAAALQSISGLADSDITRLLTVGPRSLAVGWALPVVLLIAMRSWKRLGRYGNVGLGIIAFCFLLMSPLGTPIWKLPPLTYVIYPWRLVQIVLMVGGFFGARLISAVSKKRVLATTLVFLALLSAIQVLSVRPHLKELSPDWFATTPADVIGEYLPKGTTLADLRQRNGPQEVPSAWREETPVRRAGIVLSLAGLAFLPLYIFGIDTPKERFIY